MNDKICILQIIYIFSTYSVSFPFLNFAKHSIFYSTIQFFSINLIKSIVFLLLGFILLENFFSIWNVTLNIINQFKSKHFDHETRPLCPLLLLSLWKRTKLGSFWFRWFWLNCHCCCCCCNHWYDQDNELINRFIQAKWLLVMQWLFINFFKWFEWAFSWSNDANWNTNERNLWKCD